MKIIVINKKYDDFFVVSHIDEQKLKGKIAEECMKRNWDDGDCHI